MLVELQRFADPAAVVFEGWPISLDQARHRWARAFWVYTKDLADAEPPLTPHAVTLDFDAIEDAFYQQVRLVNPSVEAAAIDLADAWRAGIHALELGAIAANATPEDFEFEAMDSDDVDDRREALRAGLVVAFRTGSATRRLDLEQITDQFHAATLGLVSTPTPYQVRYG
jgi:hypothetical protein